MTKTKVTRPKDALSLLADVIKYRRGIGKYDFSRLPDQEGENAAFDAWMELENRILAILANNLIKIGYWRQR